MITETLLTISNFVISIIINLFPAGTGFPSSVHTAASYLGQNVGFLNPIIPLETLQQILLLIIGIEILIFTFKTVKWAVSFLPFVGGRG